MTNEENGRGPRSQLDRLRAAPGPQQSLTGRQAGAGAPATPVEPDRSAAQPPAPLADRDRLIPLSLTAITSVLDSMGAKYFVDGDDAVGGIWEHGYFYFFLLADGAEAPVLQVHGQWERVLPVELYPQAAIFTNEWNAERVWPKAYVRTIEDDQAVGVYGELTVDFGPTVTRDQLDRTINTGIASALALFEEVHATFPESVEIEF